MRVQTQVFGCDLGVRVRNSSGPGRVVLGHVVGKSLPNTVTLDSSTKRVAPARAAASRTFRVPSVLTRQKCSVDDGIPPSPRCGSPRRGRRTPAARPRTSDVGIDVGSRDVQAHHLIPALRELRPAPRPMNPFDPLPVPSRPPAYGRPFDLVRGFGRCAFRSSNDLRLVESDPDRAGGPESGESSTHRGNASCPTPGSPVAHRRTNAAAPGRRCWPRRRDSSPDGVSQWWSGPLPSRMVRSAPGASVSYCPNSYPKPPARIS